MRHRTEQTFEGLNVTLVESSPTTRPRWILMPLRHGDGGATAGRHRQVVASPTGPTRHRHKQRDGSNQEPHQQDHVFPAPRFPSGVAVAPTMVLLVLLAAAACLIALETPAIDWPSGLTTGFVELPAQLPGLALAVIALCAYFELRVFIVGPVRRLRDDLEAEVAGYDGPVRRSILRETDRIAKALRLHPRETAQKRRTIQSTVALWLVGVEVISCLATASMLVGNRATAPEALAAEGQQITETVAAAVRHELEEGLAGLAGVAINGSSVDVDTTAAQALAVRPIFRAVEVLDSSGHPVASSGDSIASFASTPPVGITLLNDTGAEPVLVAVTAFEGGYSLVGEYDIRALNDRLRVANSRITVVDADMRTILSNVGYRAFTELSRPALRDAVTRAASATPTEPSSSVTVGSLISAHRVGFQDATASLGWVVVQEQDVAAAAFARDPAGRAAMVISGLSAALVVSILCWMYVGTTRPLRRLSAYANAIAAASMGEATPMPMAPERVNEAGAIVAALNRHLVLVIRARNANAASTLEATAPIRVRSSVSMPAGYVPAPRTEFADVDVTRPLKVIVPSPSGIAPPPRSQRDCKLR
jgi:hypothetical protein